jgi:plasmid stability protein
MDSTIRNLDERAYRELKARAALEGKTMGEAVSDAIRAYLARTAPDLEPEDYPEGNERLSLEVDTILYGI